MLMLGLLVVLSSCGKGDNGSGAAEAAKTRKLNEWIEISKSESSYEQLWALERLKGNRSAAAIKAIEALGDSNNLNVQNLAYESLDEINFSSNSLKESLDSYKGAMRKFSKLLGAEKSARKEYFSDKSDREYTRKLLNQAEARLKVSRVNLNKEISALSKFKSSEAVLALAGYGVESDDLAMEDYSIRRKMLEAILDIDTKYAINFLQMQATKGKLKSVITLNSERVIDSFIRKLNSRSYSQRHFQAAYKIVETSFNVGLTGDNVRLLSALESTKVKREEVLGLLLRVLPLYADSRDAKSVKNKGPEAWFWNLRSLISMLSGYPESKEALKAVLSYKDHRAYHVREAVVSALKQFKGSEHAVKTLWKLSKDENDNVKYSAAHALSVANKINLKKALLLVQDDSNRLLQKEALKVLIASKGLESTRMLIDISETADVADFRIMATKELSYR